MWTKVFRFHQKLAHLLRDAISFWGVGGLEVVYGLVYREVWKAHIFFYEYISIQVSLRLIKWHTYIHTNGV